jgi:hypothetical protein
MLLDCFAVLKRRGELQLALDPTHSVLPTPSNISLKTGTSSSPEHTASVGADDGAALGSTVGDVVGDAEVGDILGDTVYGYMFRSKVTSASRMLRCPLPNSNASL